MFLYVHIQEDEKFCHFFFNFMLSSGRKVEEMLLSFLWNEWNFPD